MQITRCRTCGQRHRGTCLEAGTLVSDDQDTPPLDNPTADERERHQDTPAAPKPANTLQEAPKSDAKKLRQARYRERHREAYNARQRELMRRRRSHESETDGGRRAAATGESGDPGVGIAGGGTGEKGEGPA